MWTRVVPALLFLSSIFAAASTPPVPQIYLVSILAFSSLYVFHKKIIGNRIVGSVSGYFALALTSLAVYMFAVYQTPAPEISYLSNEYLRIVAKYLLAPLIFTMSILIPWESAGIQRLFIRTLISVLIVLSTVKLANQIQTGFVVGNMHSNYMGLVAAIGIAFFYLFKIEPKVSKGLLFILIIVSLASILISFSRGAFVTVLFSVVVFLTTKKFLYRKHFSLVMISGVLATILTVSIYFDEWMNSDDGYQLNEISESFSGKRFDTGRSRLWRQAIDLIESNPMYGIGVDAQRSYQRQMRDGRVITLSVHNYYLAVLLEAGIVGFISVMVFLLHTYFKFFTRRNTYSVVGNCIFLGVLVYQTSQVSLTTGTFTASALIWFTLGAAGRFVNFRSASLTNRIQ